MIYTQRFFKNRINIVPLAVGSKKNTVKHQHLTNEASILSHITGSVDPGVSKFSYFCSTLMLLVGR